MTESERGAFAALLTDALAYWRQDVSAFTLRVWWDGCRAFDLEQVGRALSAHAADAERGRFAPLLADVVRALHGTRADRSLLAWGRVLEAMQRVGAYESVAFDDAAVHAAVGDLGGWPAVCRSSVDDLPHLQRRFCQAHAAYSQRPGDAYPPHLAGDCELTNRLAGQRVNPPVLIGDPEQAMSVMAAARGRERLTLTPQSAGAALKTMLLPAGMRASA
jgi:hypothetical protein